MGIEVGGRVSYETLGNGRRYGTLKCIDGDVGWIAVEDSSGGKIHYTLSMKILNEERVFSVGERVCMRQGSNWETSIVEVGEVLAVYGSALWVKVSEHDLRIWDSCRVE